MTTTVLETPPAAAAPAPAAAPPAAPPAPAPAPAAAASPPEPPATSPPEPAPAFDWRKDIAGDDEKLFKNLERYPDLKTFHKAFDDTQKALRDSGRVKLLGKDATDEDRKAFAKAVGIPEKADGYKIKLELPEGVTLDENDQAQMKAITEMLHARGGMAATPETVKAAHEIFVEMRETAQAALVAAGQKAHEDTLKTLKGEWGADFKNNMGYAQAALTGLFGKETAGEILNMRLEDGTKVGDWAPFLRAMTTAGRQLAQDPLFLPTNSLQGDPKTLAARKAEIYALRTGDAAQQKLYASPEIQQELDTILAKEIASLSGRAA